MRFDRCMCPWNSHPSQDGEHFHHLREPLCVLSPKLPHPLLTSYHFSAVFHHMWILPVLEFHINGIMQSVFFVCIWHLFGQCLAFIYFVACISILFLFFYRQVVSHCMAKLYLSTYLLVGIWVISDVWILWESFSEHYCSLSLFVIVVAKHI